MKRSERSQASEASKAEREMGQGAPALKREGMRAISNGFVDAYQAYRSHDTGKRPKGIGPSNGSGHFSPEVFKELLKLIGINSAADFGEVVGLGASSASDIYNNPERSLREKHVDNLLPLVRKALDEAENEASETSEEYDRLECLALKAVSEDDRKKYQERAGEAFKRNGDANKRHMGLQRLIWELTSWSARNPPVAEMRREYRSRALVEGLELLNEEDSELLVSVMDALLRRGASVESKRLCDSLRRTEYGTYAGFSDLAELISPTALETHGPWDPSIAPDAYDPAYEALDAYTGYVVRSKQDDDHRPSKR